MIDCSSGKNEVERTTIAFNGSVYGVGSTENAFGAQIAGDGDMGDVWRASGSRLGLALGMRTAMMWGCRLGSRGGRARREKELWRRNHRRYARRVLRGRTGRLERRRRRWEFRRGARTSSEGAGRTAIFPARKKGGTAARSQIGRGGSLARSALSAAEEHTGGTVADRTFVGRSVVVLLASREVRSGKIFDGALIILLQCFYSFSFFSRRGGGGERA